MKVPSILHLFELTDTFDILNCIIIQWDNGIAYFRNLKSLRNDCHYSNDFPFEVCA